MAQFPSIEEYEKHNPLVRYSFYANGRVQVLLGLSVEILAELDKAFSDDSVILHHLSRAEELSWLWILGSYEVVRTMCQANACFSVRANAALKKLKFELSRVRMPAAKMEVPKQPISITSSRSAAGLTLSDRDLLVGDPSHPRPLRGLLEHFCAVFSQLDGSDVLATHESVYAVKAKR